MQPRVREAAAQDLEALTEIYNHYVESGPITFDTRPFTVAERQEWLQRFDTSGRYRLLVAEEAGRIRGYASSLPLRPKPAYDSSVEVTAYLAPDATGAGLGTLLYHALFDVLSGQDLHRAFAGITLPNPASIRLHQRFGFRQVGMWGEVGTKHGRTWDVAWYEKDLTQTLPSFE